MKKKLIRKYARAIAIKGIGLRKDQQVEISAPTSASDFVEILVDELYKNNASRVIINWQNPAINKLKYKYQSLKTLKELPEYELSITPIEFVCRIPKFLKVELRGTMCASYPSGSFIETPREIILKSPAFISTVSAERRSIQSDLFSTKQSFGCSKSW